jgi:hypothetical protein
MVTENVAPRTARVKPNEAVQSFKSGKYRIRGFNSHLINNLSAPLPRTVKDLPRSDPEANSDHHEQ